MESTSQPIVNNRMKMDIKSLAIDRDDLKKLCKILQERNNAAADIEESLFQQKDQTDEQYEENKKTLKDSFELKITITGKDGEELWGTIDDVFGSANFPEQVTSLYIDSESFLRNVHNYYPHNSFKIFLDFSKSKIFDLSLMPSHSTPNGSNIEVKGYNATWVNGLFSELKKFFDSRSSTFSIVHGHSIYDVLLWLLGFPLSFWIVSNLSTQIESVFMDISIFATNALYLYIFIGTLLIFRFLFHYLRWVCPLVEFRSKENKMLAHRTILAVLSIGWFGQFIYDILKWLF